MADELSYLHGFGNEHETEALAGALPVGRFSPQKVNYGLYAEVFSSTAETWHPALALDSDHVYVAFPTKHDASTYRTLFRRLVRSTGTWGAV